jgi:hypothetical protein
MNSPAIEPSLKFNHDLYHPNDRGNLLLHFREQGFVVLPNVFEPDSVDPFIEQFKTQVVEGKTWNNPLELLTHDPLVVHPAKAPRLLQVLRGTFMPWIDEPHPVLLNPVWLVKPSNPDERLVHDWHKDADHVGLSTLHGYTHPQVIHTAIYFSDMTPEMGPTYVIPRSHRDPNLSPYSGAEEAPLLSRKADVIIWDQRLWHRASARTVPGIRIVGILTFIPAPVQAPMKRSHAQLEAFKAATSVEEKILFGGPFKSNDEV